MPPLPKQLKQLAALTPGETGRIKELEAPVAGQVRLLEMGLLPGRSLRLVRKMPFNGPVEIKLGESYLILRREEASQILVEALENGVGETE